MPTPSQSPLVATHWKCCGCQNIWLWALYSACTTCGHRRCASCKGIRPAAKRWEEDQKGLVTSSTNPTSRSEERKNEHRNPSRQVRVQEIAEQSSGRRLSRPASSAEIFQYQPAGISVEDAEECTLEPALEWPHAQAYRRYVSSSDREDVMPQIKSENINIAEPHTVKTSLLEQLNQSDDTIRDNDSDSEHGATHKEFEGAGENLQETPEPSLWSNLKNCAALTLLLDRNIHYHVSQLTLNPSTHEPTRTNTDNWKLGLEARLRSPVLWWPLNAPNQGCGDGETTVAWNCSCGASLKMELSNAQAEAFCRRVGLVAKSPGQPPLLPTHQSQQSQGSQNVPSTSRNAQASTSALGQQAPLRSPRRGSNTALLRSAAVIPAAAQVQSSQKYLYWCVEIGPTEIKLVEFDINDITESNLVPSLLERYHALRGLRSWLTLTSCAGVRLIKFSKLFKESDHVTYLRDELPCRKTNTEYEYQYFDPTMPEKDFIKIIQSIIALRIRKPSCPEIVRLGSALDYIPKKVNGRMQRSDGYGVYAVSAYCFWKVTVVLCIVSTPSVAFMIRWLVGHKGDWQNALTWLMLTFTVFNIVVLQHDRWSMETLG